MTAVVVWIALTLISALLSAELVAWSTPLQRALIRKAAAVLPREHARRYTEEWYGELEELPDGPATRLLWVTSLVFRRGALARELGVPRSVVGFSGALKRAIDLVLSLFGTVAIAPVLALVALAIKLEDGGPVIFKQSRVGLDGTTFTMFQFRSMRFDAEAKLAQLRAENQGIGVMFKVASDPRITRVGRLLRRFSLDELPQLFNVILGHMSLVGPRALLQSEVDIYENDARRRLLVTPGVTGLWQVSGRSFLNWGDAVRLDLRYVEDWTLKMDLLILWKTVTIVMRY